MLNAMKYLTVALLAHGVGAFADSPTEVAELLAGDRESGDFFGFAVDIDGNTALIGAALEDIPGGGGFNAGAAYVFTFDGTSWIEIQKLTASDRAANNFFGSAVALDGTRALIGASAIGVIKGAVHVFDFDGTSWTETC